MVWRDIFIKQLELSKFLDTSPFVRTQKILITLNGNKQNKNKTFKLKKMLKKQLLHHVQFGVIF